MAQRDTWHRDLERVISRRSELERHLTLTDDERTAIDALRTEYPLLISRHYLSLIDPDDPDDPLRRVVVPSSNELAYRPGEEDDDVHSDEASYQPCPGIIHRYPGKLLFIPTLACPSHCRFCFRKGRKVKHLSEEEGREALDYIRRNESIRDVIVTGGEPLILDDDEIDYYLSSIRAIPHVEIIRMTSRFPIYIPSRVTDSLIEILARYKPFYLTLSFVHPREITPEIEDLLGRLSDAGIVLLQQGPLLKGVNDDTDVLRQLYEKLARNRVLPYYAIWGIHAPGAEHFLVDGEEASRLLGALENRTSGFCIPHLITIARGDKVRMMGWSPERVQEHLDKRRARTSSAPSRIDVPHETPHT